MSGREVAASNSRREAKSMTETEQKPEKKPLSPEELAFREAKHMKNRHMLNRIRRIAETTRSNADATWAIVLSVVLENTKPLGRMEPYLR